jgi:hypothetical protein
MGLQLENSGGVAHPLSLRQLLPMLHLQPSLPAMCLHAARAALPRLGIELNRIINRRPNQSGHIEHPGRRLVSGDACRRLDIPFDDDVNFGYGLTMAQDARQLLDNVLAYCDSKWLETHEAPPSEWPTPDVQTGRKMTYNDVKHYVAKLLGIVS